VSGSRLRVAYLGHTASLSGGEIAVANLIGALEGVDAHVLLAEDGPMVARFEAAGARVEVVGLGEQSRTLHRDQVAGLAAVRPAVDAVGYAARLARRLRTLQPDLVHTISLKSALYGATAARLARRPVVWSIQDRIAPDYLPGPVVQMVWTASRVLPSAIIANSAATAATLPRGRARVDVVHPAVPVLPAAPARREPPYRAGVVGRLSPWKGQRVFLDAFAKAFAGTGAEARLIGAPLFGEEAYEAELRGQIDHLGLGGRVELRGHRDDVAAELADLDVVVHCSTVPEPFGQVVVEAMGVGRPVVAAAAGGPLEIVTDGVDGLLTPPGDAEALAAALTRLAADRALGDRLVASAHLTAERFAPEAAAVATRAVYARVLARGRAR
jgi:glycosyltransferase involved in cell wall biosynthesis